MFLTTILTLLSVLAFSICITTPASAQHLYGELHGEYAHGDSYSHYDHGHGYRHDSHHNYHHGHNAFHRYRHIAYPNTVLSRHQTIPVHAEASCRYGNDSVYRESLGCPLRCDRTLPNGLVDQYQPAFGFGALGHNHPHVGDSHSGHSHGGHSHEGHSHEGHSHGPQFPSRDAVPPSDQDYFGQPSLPHDSVRDRQPQSEFRREQLPSEDSIRMNSPPPPSLGPSSSSQPGNVTPKRIDTPPPPTV